MQKIIALFTSSLLIYSICSYVVIQSDVNQLITYPNPPHLPTLSNLNSKLKIPQAPTAAWIWDKNWDNQNCERRVSISQYFLVSCQGQITIYATASNKFNISINGFPVILSGDDQNKIFSAVIPKQQLKSCRFINSFSMTAKIDNFKCQKQNCPGMIYALVQNTENCYKCPPGYYYNLAACGCRQIFPVFIFNFDYPKQIYECPETKQCKYYEFLDQRDCECRCIVNQVCNLSWKFDQNLCKCVRNYDLEKSHMPLVSGAMIKG